MKQLLQNLSLRMFIIPVSMLVLAVGLISFTEYRKNTHNNEIRRVVDNQARSIVTQFQQAVWSFDAALDAIALDGQDAQTMHRKMQRLLQEFENYTKTLSGYYYKDYIDGEEHIAESEIVNGMVAKVKTIRDIIKTDPALTSSQYHELRHNLLDMMSLVSQLNEMIAKTYQAELNAVLNHLESDEKQGSFLVILLLIGGFALIVVLFDAVYHHKRNAERARAAERCNAIFAAALQSTRVGVLIRDMRKAEHPVVFVNAAFSRLTGYSFEDIRGDSSEFLFGWNTDPSSIAAFRRATSLQETATFELLLYRKNGSPFWSEWHLSPLMGEDGKLAYFVSLFTDNSAIRHTQEELIQAKTVAEKASAVKTNFLAMMSHEIRTPINGLLGVIKLLNETHVDDEQRHLLSIAKTSSAALHNIINDILDYAKIEAGKIDIYVEPFSLGELMAELKEFSQTLVGEKNIRVDISVPDNLPDRLLGDVGRLRQIILNLVSNAIKFTDTGSITIRCVSMMPQEVSGMPGHLLRFEVQDTGVGISKEDQSKLFLEFSQVEQAQTRRYGGTGLGLAICRRLIMLMKGEIGVESQPGKGSRFWFMLPLAEAVEPLVPVTSETFQIAPASTDSPTGKRVLLVEDNDTNRLVASRYLQKIGVSVDEALDGEQAIAKAKENEYDLILMDISMPKMDGMLATCHVRSLGGHNVKVPIIALTAHVMAGDRELCLAAGMNDYLNKPLEYPALVRMLERWMNVRLNSNTPSKPLAEMQTPPKTSPTKEVPAAPLPTQVSVPYNKDDLAPVFDEQVLERMKNDLGAPVVLQVTQTFLSDSARRMEGIDKLRVEELKDVAHTLKSSSGSCGLSRFSQLMADMERAATVQDREKIALLMPLVEDVYAVSRARLEKERKNYA